MGCRQTDKHPQISTNGNSSNVGIRKHDRLCVRFALTFRHGFSQPTEVTTDEMAILKKRNVPLYLYLSQKLFSLYLVEAIKLRKTSIRKGENILQGFDFLSKENILNKYVD